jgi:hypothetical protein
MTHAHGLIVRLVFVLVGIVAIGCAGDRSSRDGATTAEAPITTDNATGGQNDASGAGGSALGGNGGNLDAATSANAGSTGSGGAGTGGVGGTGDGAGGSSTGGPLPYDGGCRPLAVAASRDSVDGLLVLDRSSSLYYSIDQDCFCSQADMDASGSSSSGGGALCRDTVGCKNRWSAVRSAVTVTLANGNDIRWGLKLFGTPDTPSCSVSASMEVPIVADTASTIEALIASSTMSIGTPTRAALAAATAYLKTVTDNRPKFILLATDGEPNCGGNPPTILNADLDGARSVAAAAYAAGFPVYVVGIGPNLSNLTMLARSGGTGDYYQASSPEQLAQAFATVSQSVGSCTFVLASDPPDPGNVAIYLDKSLLPKDDANGWRFGESSRTIVLEGEACDRVNSGQGTRVDALFGCPGGSLPPPVLP